MKRLLIIFLFDTILLAQSGSDPTVIRMGASAPAGVTNVTAQIVGQAGNNNYYYWVVANFPIGQTQVSPFAQLINAPSLSGSNYVTVLWSPIGATSYDVLRTTTPFIPNPCTCAVATEQTGSSVNDTGGALSSYTYAPTSNASAKFELDNRNFSQPVIYGNTPYNSVLFANLPSASSSKGLTYLVVDASSNSSCNAGGGSNTPAICWSNGTSWVSLGNSSGSGPPTGVAGGVLSGTYPNPCSATLSCGTVAPTMNCTPGVTPDYLNTATSPATRYYCSATNTWAVGQRVVGNLSVGNMVLGNTGAMQILPDTNAVAVPFLTVTPPSRAPWQQIFNSTGPQSDGSYDHLAVSGWNAGVFVNNGIGSTPNAPALFQGFEDGWDASGVEGMEWYLAYYSPDHTTVELFRPFYVRITDTSNTSHGAAIGVDIGTDGTGAFCIDNGGAICTWTITSNTLRWKSLTGDTNTILDAPSGSVPVLVFNNNGATGFGWYSGAANQLVMTDKSGNTFITYNYGASAATALVSMTAQLAIAATAFVPTIQLASPSGSPTTIAQPACSSGSAGRLWYSGHTTSTKDSVAICAADATDTWAWRTIY